MKATKTRITKGSALGKTLRRAALPAAGLVLMAFFGAYAVLGPNGILAYGDYKRQLVKREKDYAALDAKRTVLKNRVALLDPDHANPDMVDEMVRKELNVAHPDEVIVPLGNQ
ncbi:cell division protein FtsB [Sphingomonas jinjuensis]|uniref:Cell division protein FtsB n=1 Tax=Sphingomonas jinjuensis TaxID=535907 RepID=A0A840F8L5_9SPHN|nr:septum formation initiator family protein [Sphingomonas jinjuensis]MBB4152952.1 cell division protein FtsB [Sphingomonas jinjuensis]